jgi:hypothetical protein
MNSRRWNSESRNALAGEFQGSKTRGGEYTHGEPGSDQTGREAKTLFKSIAVVAASYLLSVILVLATDPLLSRLFPDDYVRGRVPSDTALLTSTALFVVVSIFCAWVCARLDIGRAPRHVLWFFIVGELMGLGATVPNWSKGWPHWYWLSWLLTWPLSCWIGLRLSGRRPNAVA